MANKVDLKLVVLGQNHVGKTCIINRYLHDHFGATCSTVGAAFALKRVALNNRTCNLGLWDTAGQERFDSLSKFYCRKAQAALLCYDITNRETFEVIPKWAQRLKDDAEPDCTVILVGCKVDMVSPDIPRAVTPEEADELARSLGGKFFETSSKTGYNIKEMFDHAVEVYFGSGNGKDREATAGEQVNLKSLGATGSSGKGCCS